MSTSENLRHHAAGHLAAASMLVAHGHEEAAKLVLQAVLEYVHHPLVSAPPQLVAKLAESTDAPIEHSIDIRLLEEWFCHPLNTVIENSGRALTT